MVIKVKIKANQKYKEQCVKLNDLKDKYSQEYKAVSEVYWPKYDQNKKKIKDNRYIIGVFICMLVVETMLVIFEALRNEYLIGAVYAITIGLLVYGIIKYILLMKKVKVFSIEWEKKNKGLKDMQDSIKSLSDEMVEEMIMIMCLNDNHYEEIKNDEKWKEDYQNTKDKVLEETANSLAYDDVVLVFNNWVDRF